MAGEISFFEIGVDDPEKARAFYGELFDSWKFETGPSGDGYVISTGSIPGGVHSGDEGRWLEDSEDSVTEFGRFALCKDDQGSGFGLHQPPAG